MGAMKRIAAGILCATLLLAAGCGGGGQSLAKKDPTPIMVWHYYNGDQQQVFDRLVQEFNETEGAKLGIVVEARSYGGVSDLNGKVLDAIYEKVGAEEVPDIFAAYADTAYEINGLGKVADLSQYLTQAEWDAYLSGYLEEGRFEDAGGYKIFPVAKSTEVLTLNKTEWDRFTAATGADEGELSTWEGITALAEDYYLWTDGLTPDVSEDGKAFFGRDAFANYIIIGSMQMGSELFGVSDGNMKLHVDEGAMRRLWDNYYAPYISGYFGAFGKFRSDDIRTGDLVACVGATSGATYFPTEVTKADGSTYPIEGAVYPLPNFAGAAPMAVQQGAGMVVTKSTPEREAAAVEFLKWMTRPEQNVRFAAASGYLPVTYAANKATALIEDTFDQVKASDLLRESLTIGMGMTDTYEFYTPRPFEKGSDARKAVDTSLRERAAEDRAAVLALMAEGATRADAVAQFDTDENFQSWLGQFHTALEAATAG